MSRHIKGSPGHFNTALPGGWVLDPDDEVVVSDAEWTEILSTGLAAFLVDLGPVSTTPTRAPSFRDIQRITVTGVVAGPPGPPGSPGAPGAPGSPGTNGTDGTDGTDGADGRSAYEIAVADGFVGTEAAWLASLVGPAGPAGSPADWVTETPIGSTDAVNHIFTTTNNFVSGSVRVFLNGMRQYLTSFTESGLNQLDLSFAPYPGDELIVDYIKA